jgi:error-prone DNA polymerase
VKDAQRHGLKIKPIDVTCSDWLCTLERIPADFSVRLGLRFVNGLRAEIASEILRQRALGLFASIDDLERRVPAIQKSELVKLAEVGALNFISGSEGRTTHRRDALWQIERATRRAGPLLESSGAGKLLGEEIERSVEEREEAEVSVSKASVENHSPLLQMTPEERLVADFRGTGITTGPHPMAFHRARMKKHRVRSAVELRNLPHGSQVRVAGGVIARQRPGTANGFVFLSIEDETGIANAILTPQIFDRYHALVVHEQFLLIDGELQNQDGVVSVKAARVRPLQVTRAKTISHDFH